MIIAETEFIIDSSRERIWQVLVKAIMRCLPFQRMQLLDEKNFRGVLPIKVGFITLPMHIKIEIVDISPPETLATILEAKGMGGVAWLNQKTTFTLTPIDESQTEVTGTVVAEEMAVLLRIFLLWRVKSFARESLESIEGLLRQWA